MAVHHVQASGGQIPPEEQQSLDYNPSSTSSLKVPTNRTAQDNSGKRSTAPGEHPSPHIVVNEPVRPSSIRGELPHGTHDSKAVDGENVSWDSIRMPSPARTDALDLEDDYRYMTQTFRPAPGYKAILTGDAINAIYDRPPTLYADREEPLGEIEQGTGVTATMTPRQLSHQVADASSGCVRRCIWAPIRTIHNSRLSSTQIPAGTFGDADVSADWRQMLQSMRGKSWCSCHNLSGCTTYGGCECAWSGNDCSQFCDCSPQSCTQQGNNLGVYDYWTCRPLNGKPGTLVFSSNTALDGKRTDTPSTLDLSRAATVEPLPQSPRHSVQSSTRPATLVKQGAENKGAGAAGVAGAMPTDVVPPKYAVVLEPDAGNAGNMDERATSAPPDGPDSRHEIDCQFSVESMAVSGGVPARQARCAQLLPTGTMLSDDHEISKILPATDGANVEELEMSVRSAASDDMFPGPRKGSMKIPEFPHIDETDSTCSAILNATAGILPKDGETSVQASTLGDFERVLDKSSLNEAAAGPTEATIGNHRADSTRCHNRSQLQCTRLTGTAHRGERPLFFQPLALPTSPIGLESGNAVMNKFNSQPRLDPNAVCPSLPTVSQRLIIGSSSLSPENKYSARSTANRRCQSANEYGEHSNAIQRERMPIQNVPLTAPGEHNPSAESSRQPDAHSSRAVESSKAAEARARPGPQRLPQDDGSGSPAASKRKRHLLGNAATDMPLKELSSSAQTRTILQPKRPGRGAGTRGPKLSKLEPQDATDIATSSGKFELSYERPHGSTVLPHETTGSTTGNIRQLDLHHWDLPHTSSPIPVPVVPAEWAIRPYEPLTDVDARIKKSAPVAVPTAIDYNPSSEDSGARKEKSLSLELKSVRPISPDFCRDQNGSQQLGGMRTQPKPTENFPTGDVDGGDPQKRCRLRTSVLKLAPVRPQESAREPNCLRSPTPRPTVRVQQHSSVELATIQELSDTYQAKLSAADPDRLDLADHVGDGSDGSDVHADGVANIDGHSEILRTVLAADTADHEDSDYRRSDDLNSGHSSAEGPESPHSHSTATFPSGGTTCQDGAAGSDHITEWGKDYQAWLQAQYPDISETHTHQQHNGSSGYSELTDDDADESGNEVGAKAGFPQWGISLKTV
jgi:hypothetical protein